MRDFSENDMYLPVKKFFSELGFKVNAEVKNCDITLLKDNKLIIVEMKKHFCLELLFQAMERQSLADEVYVAVPRFKTAKGRKYNNILNIVKKLELGLITIAMDSPVKTVEILHFPKTSKVKANLKNSIISEIHGRSVELNSGGSTGTKIITAYREKAVKIACTLNFAGPLKASVLVRDYSCDKNTYSILRNNVYGWFDRMPNARFSLNKVGLTELCSGSLKQLFDYYTELLSKVGYAHNPISTREAKKELSESVVFEN